MAQTKAQLIDGKGAVDLGAFSISGSAPDNSVNLDASGRLLVGTSSSRTVEDCGGNGIEASLQIEKAGASSALSLIANSNGSGEHCGTLNLGRSSGTTIGSNTLVVSGDKVGAIVFNAADGTDIRSRAAEILCAIDGTPGTNDMPGRLVFSTTADGASSPTERMRINSAGEVQVGATSFAFTPRFGISADGVTYSTIQQINNTNTGASSVQMIRFTWNGTSVGRIESTSSATSYLSGSDYRLKDNIQPITGALEKIAALKPCTFKWKIDGKAGQGFIAHELQEVVADCVSGEKDAVDADGNPEYQGIDQSKLVPLLTAALQEAIAKIKTLEARLTAAGIE